MTGGWGTILWKQFGSDAFYEEINTWVLKLNFSLAELSFQAFGLSSEEKDCHCETDLRVKQIFLALSVLIAMYMFPESFRKSVQLTLQDSDRVTWSKEP